MGAPVIPAAAVCLLRPRAADKEAVVKAQFRPTQIMVMLGGVTRNAVFGRYIRNNPGSASSSEAS